MKTRLMPILFASVLGAISCFPHVALTQTSGEKAAAHVGAPPELAQWADWVLHGEVGYQCAYRSGAQGSGPASRACVSVSPLELMPSPQGTEFRFEVDMDEAGSLLVPSSLNAWPQDIKVNGHPAELRKDSQNQWHVILAKGTAVIEGSWPSQVEQVQVPSVFAYARNLRTDQALVVDKGTVWVSARPVVAPTVSEAPTSPTAQVWRLLEDDAVPRLTTRLTIIVPNSERLVLGPVLPKGFEPVSWTANAELSLLEDGTIHLQAPRGQVMVELVARCTHACAAQSSDTLSPIAPPAPTDKVWPSSEVWSFRSQPVFRHLTAMASGVDPAAAGVPDEWSHLPAFRLAPSQPLSFKTVSRGPGAIQGEGLTLWRRVWHTPSQWLQLDFLQGEMSSPARLAMSAPHELQSAHSTASPLPLTVLEYGGAPGVQWPTTQVEMLAQSVRGLDTGLTPGWNQTVSNMHVLLHLPVGEVLLAAPGNQNRATEWVDNFTLLRFFGIALLGFIVFHLRHQRRLLAPLAVLLAAGWVHNLAAQVLLVIIGGIGGILIVANALPQGRARLAMRLASTGLLIMALVGITPFLITQAHHLLYPSHQSNQTTYVQAFTPPESSDLVADFMVGTDSSNRYGYSVGYEQVEVTSQMRAAKHSEVMDQAVSAPMPVASPPPELQQDPLAGLGLARVGTALPQWPTQLTNSYQLHYPGPLLSTTQASPFSLWILPAWATWIARLLGSIGMLVLLMGLAGRMYQEWLLARTKPISPHDQGKGPIGPGSQALASLALLVLTTSILVSPSDALAQATPPQANASPSQLDGQLDELRRRLLSPPACAPMCATLTHATLKADDNEVRATYLVSAQATTTWTPPTPRGGVLASAEINGKPALFHGPDIRLSEGRSRVVVVYHVQADPFVLEFAHSPLAVQEELSPGWMSEGVDAGSRLSSPAGASWVLRQVKAQQATIQGTAPMPSSVDPVVLAHLERAFDFSRAITIDYRVSRLDPVNRAMKVSWPKLPGESMDSDRVEDKGGDWEVVLAANETSLSWRSTLPNATSLLEIAALPATMGQESWRISGSPAWELKLEGVPQTQASAHGNIMLLPLPQETLRLEGRRLSVLDGPTQRLDKASMSTVAGARTARHELILEVFTTQAGSHALGLPVDATLVSVSRNGQPLPLPLENGHLDIPLERGVQQVLVVFQSAVGKTLLKAPELSFDGQVSNLHWELDPGPRRWVLAAGGPGTGPAIFYWPLLLVFLVLAYAVSRLPASPLSWPTALLLTLGLSMLPHTLVMLISIVGWLWLIRYRAGLNVDTISASNFRALQVGLVLWTGWCALLVLGNLGWGLIGASPDMMIESYDGRGDVLAWYLPADPAGIPGLPWVFSLPMWIYQAILLAWSLWFTAWIFSAGKKALVAFTQGGHWRSRVR